MCHDMVLVCNFSTTMIPMWLCVLPFFGVWKSRHWHMTWTYSKIHKYKRAHTQTHTEIKYSKTICTLWWEHTIEQIELFVCDWSKKPKLNVFLVYTNLNRKSREENEINLSNELVNAYVLQWERMRMHDKERQNTLDVWE